MNRLLTLVKGLLALAVIVALIVGAPLLILASGLLPTELPSLSEITQALTSRDETGTVLVTVLVLIGALLWVAFTYSVLREVAGAVRGVRLPAPKGPAGRPAAALVGAVIAMGAATMPATAAPAAPPAAMTLSVQDATHATTDATTDEAAETTQAQPPAQSAAEHTVTVQRHETLWGIADRELGDGARYTEIADLNGIPEPFTITPGQELRVPGHAPTAVTVERGDTLAAIAATYDTTTADLVASNPSIADPDLIYPGETITLPASETPGTPARETPQAPAAQTPDTTQASRAGELAAAPQPDQATAPPAEESAPSAPSTQAPAAQTQDVPPVASPAPSDSQDDALQDVAGIAAFAGAGLVLAAGTLTLLRRRRADQRRHRRPGRAAPLPPPELIPVEKGVRAAGGAGLATLETMDAALRSLAADCASLGTPFPSVAAVEIDGPRVVAHLSEPAELPAPWVGNETLWTFTRADSDEPVVAAEGEAPLPTLVTIGTGPQGQVWLLNLEDLGAVSVVGDPGRGEDLLRYMAAELAVNSWSQDVRVDLVDVAPEIAASDPGRIHLHDLPGEAAQDLTAHAVASIDRCTAEDTTVTTARASASGDDLWSASALLVARHEDDPHVAEAARTVAASTGRSAAAVLTLSSTGHDDTVSTVIEVRADGHLVMPDSGLVLRACSLPADEAQGIVQLLDQGRDQHDEAMPVPEADEDDWRAMTDAAGALREEYTQPRGTLAITEPSSSLLPDGEEEWVEQTATTVEDVQRLAPQVAETVRDEIEERDPTLDADLQAWHSQDCDRPRLALLGPVTARVGGDARAVLEDSRAYLTELLAYLALRPQGATMAEVREAFGLSDGRTRAVIKSLRDWLGTNPRTDQPHLPNAKESRAAKIRGVGVYQVDDVLTDVDLFRRLRARGQARGEHGIPDLRAALDLVKGTPFEQLRAGGWAWLAEGDRPDQQMICAVTDVAHVVITHAIATNDGPTALATAEAVMAAVPHEEVARLDLVAAMSATGHENAAEQLRRHILDTDEHAVPVDLSERTDKIVRDREWAKEAS